MFAKIRTPFENVQSNQKRALQPCYRKTCFSSGSQVGVNFGRLVVFQNTIFEELQGEAQISYMYTEKVSKFYDCKKQTPFRKFHEISSIWENKYKTTSDDYRNRTDDFLQAARAANEVNDYGKVCGFTNSIWQKT